MVILSRNSFLPIFRNYSSVFGNEVKYFGYTKQFPVAVVRRATKQQWSTAATSVSITPQDYHFDDPNHNIFQDNFLIHYEEKLENIRELLESREEEEEDPIESLIFVDTIQRFGVAGHYEKEIERIMQQHYLKLGNNSTSIYGDHSLSLPLRDVALSFRLLRQRGYHVSADVFNNFKDRDGKFRDDLKKDIWGLMELYEATHLSFEGENILHQAQVFSSKLLHEYISAAADTKSKWCNVVKMRLRHPYHKSIAKLTTEINYYLERDVGAAMNTTLTKLSVLDFLWGKHIHNQELLQVSKWWNDLGLNRQLTLARNQPIKWYTWSMAILIDDISLSEERVQLTKSIAFIYFIDDIFDVYGTLDELAIFTEAVKKWEYGAMDMVAVPDYMKLCYKSLLDTTNQIGHRICEKYGYNPINSLKQTWASLCNAFLVEAKWFASKNLPGAEEYLANGKVSSGVHVALVHLFFILGEGETNLDDVSTLISCVAAILRLWDDLGTAKDEHQNGTDGSYIECYMKDHPGSQIEQAREHVVDMIEREWKQLNKECFDLNNNHSTFKEGALNLARMVPLMYNYDDNQCLPLLKEYVKLMLLDSSI